MDLLYVYHLEIDSIHQIGNTGKNKSKKTLTRTIVEISNSYFPRPQSRQLLIESLNAKPSQ